MIKTNHTKNHLRYTLFKIHPAGWGLIFLAVLIVIGLTWAFTGNEDTTVYDKEHCDYLFNQASWNSRSASLWQENCT